LREGGKKERSYEENTFLFTHEERGKSRKITHSLYTSEKGERGKG